MAIDHGASFYPIDKSHDRPDGISISLDGDVSQQWDHFCIGKVQRIDPVSYWLVQGLNVEWLTDLLRQLDVQQQEIDKFWGRVNGVQSHILPDCSNWPRAPRCGGPVHGVHIEYYWN